MSIEKKTTITTETETDTDITPEEQELLDDSIDNSSTRDNENLRRAKLDNTDEDGELLNVSSVAGNVTGEDLDVPGSELDDENEMIGEEDEENNSYSTSDNDDNN